MRAATIVLYFFLLLEIFLSKTGSCEDLSLLELLKITQDVSLKTQEVQDEDVSFYVATKSNPQPTKITSESFQLINSTKPTKLIIHGWIENHRRQWYADLTNEYLNNGDVNIIQVDWEKPARMQYAASARSTRPVGYLVAHFIVESKLHPQSVHIIGHSLGSHVAGFASKKVFATTGQKIKRISALDPAGPYFNRFIIRENERLSKDDADIVDVLHTDGGYFGYEFPIGTLDIYVNGGTRSQPQCLESFYSISSISGVFSASFCSHARSTRYFVEWINMGRFHCKMCENFKNCKEIREITISAEEVTEETTGICLAKTNWQEPFLQ